MYLSERLRDPRLFRQQAFVAGSWVDADGGATVVVMDPATGAEIGTVPALGEQETRRAVKAAEEAWPAWRSRPSSERGRLLEEWYRSMLENIDDLSLIMTMEQGKPLAESAGEIRYGAGFIKWFSEEARRLYGDTIPAPTADRRILVLKEPVGVSAAITPWNFPNAMITRKAGPALAAGCPIVAKPSELTPFSALALAVLAERVGIPKGVFSVVTGLPQEIGAELTSNPSVRKFFHRIDACWTAFDAAIREHDQARQLRIGRERPLYCVRRRRRRSRGGGIDGQQIPQRRPDMCLCEPGSRPGRNL
jgi:succinate-semialdehyde dehydrogenase / glutarate-semialdehyde dehydrogenase